MQAAYSAYLKRYGSREEALKMLDQEYGTRIPTRHPHFIMGTVKLQPRNFILIGCCAPGSIPTSSQSRDRCFSRCRRRPLLAPQNSSCMYQPIPSHVMQKPVIAIILVRGRKSPHSNQGTSKRLCKANRT
jgi:hypothetical protein